ncbi:MAG TPA: 7-carboxy-7-deazaguanine synthase QueE [Candidatus Omnitrophota bacterium]|nr:7-carboxy-7-deazaguanine synthase QueE [Candidatus Omnitrophota bacterium]
MKIKGKISEIFESVQGEGIYLGEKQLFVRFYGCNLDCKYCDTKQRHYTEYDVDELMEELKLYTDDYHSVSFTGGEPLLQKDFLKEAMRLTSQHGYRNYLETNGTFPDELADVLQYVDVIAMDFKLPSSTGHDNFWQEHRKFLTIACGKETFVKIVICSTTKEEDVMIALALIKDINPGVILVLQPNSRDGNGRMLGTLEHFRDIATNEGVTTLIIPQIHKIAGVP